MDIHLTLDGSDVRDSMTIANVRKLAYIEAMANDRTMGAVALAPAAKPEPEMEREILQTPGGVVNVVNVGEDS